MSPNPAPEAQISGEIPTSRSAAENMELRGKKWQVATPIQSNKSCSLVAFQRKCENSEAERVETPIGCPPLAGALGENCGDTSK